MNNFELLFTATEKSASGRGARATYLQSALDRLKKQFKGDIAKLPNALAVEFAHANQMRLTHYRNGESDLAQRYPAPQVCAGAVQLVMNACCWALRRHQTELMRAERQVVAGEAFSAAEHLNFAEAFTAELGITDSATADEYEVEATANDLFGLLTNLHGFMWQTLNGGRRGPNAREFELEPLSMFHRTEVTVDDDGLARWETTCEALTWEDALAAMNAQIEELQEQEADKMQVAAANIDFTSACTLQ